MITVKILADSINPAGSRLTSFLLTYPRFIHAEFMTHRCFSRNAASSRAIPLSRMIEDVHCQPALPERWGAEQKGMQSGAPLTGDALLDAKDKWDGARSNAIGFANLLSKEAGLHKSLCNRLLEPFAHITVIATAEAKGLANFFGLRAHPAAQPEFQVLAYRMLDKYMGNAPDLLPWGEWHVPQFRHAEYQGTGFGDDHDAACPIEARLKIATARCARLSYLTFDGEHDPAKDIELHDRLAASGHWSPFEHCAQAIQPDDYKWSNFDMPELIEDSHDDLARFAGLSHWRQYRKQFSNECQQVSLETALALKPNWVTL